MDKQTINRIKKMALYVKKENIADSLNLPLDVVEAVLRDEIEATTNNHKTAKIQVVEKARFVRNKIVTSISPGGGKGNTTLLTSLAAAAAINIPNKRPVVILDLAEFPKVPTTYGIRYLDALENPDIIWPSISTWENSAAYSIDNFTIRHPDLENLYIVPGVMVADSFNELDFIEIFKIIDILQRKFEIVFIDLPKSFTLIEGLLELMDTIFITLTPEYGSLEGIIQLLPTLNKVNKKDNSFLIFNRVGYPGFFDVDDCRKLLNNMIKHNHLLIGQGLPQYMGCLPDTTSVIKYLNAGKVETIVLKEPHSTFMKEINYILNQLCPHWQVSPPKKNDRLSRVFSKLLSKKRGGY